MSSFGSKTVFGDVELIQAAPLNSDNVTRVTLDSTTPSRTITLAPDTVLVEVETRRTSGSDDVLITHGSDAAKSRTMTVPSVRTYTVTTAGVRDIVFALPEGSTSEVMIEVMEA